MNESAKKRTAVWLTPETMSRIDGMLETSGCKNRSQFLEKAARLYLDQLGLGDASAFLDLMLGKAIQKTAKSWLEELCKNLFRLCLELNMSFHVIAAYFKDEAFDLWDMRRVAIDEVRDSNGAVSFDRAAEWEQRYQEYAESSEYEYNGYDESSEYDEYDE